MSTRLACKVSEVDVAQVERQRQCDSLMLYLFDINQVSHKVNSLFYMASGQAEPKGHQTLLCMHQWSRRMQVEQLVLYRPP